MSSCHSLLYFGALEGAGYTGGVPRLRPELVYFGQSGGVCSNQLGHCVDDCSPAYFFSILNQHHHTASYDLGHSDRPRGQELERWLARAETALSVRFTTYKPLAVCP